MNWFKENKFLGMLLVVTLVLAGLFLAFGISQKGKKEDLMAQVDQAKQDITNKRNMDPFPTPGNVQEKRNNLKEVVAAANEVQEAILTYAPLAMDNIPVSQFTELFEKTENGIRELYDGKIDLSDEFHLGFERYKGEAPNAQATGVLTYQMGAFDWLFRELAAAGISQVDNFVRAELPPERGESWDESKPKKNQRRSSRTRKPKTRGPASPVIAKNLPFELTFSGREENVRQALTKIANGDKYFVVIRALRTKNPGLVPSNKKLAIGQASKNQAATEDGGDGDDLFEDDDTPAEESEEIDDSPSSQRILERVAGGEHLKVYLRADLLLFDKSPKFPEIK